ncbi:MAG: cysteine dioxygenase family protein, partial [Actinomycetota bacterium]
ALSPQAALRRAASLLLRLTREPAFLGTHVIPLLEGANDAASWYVARRYDDVSYSLQVFVWPPETATKIHDHSSWGAYRCVAGTVLEERYERLDDGSVPDHAHLRRLWRLSWGPEDGISTVLPFDGGIHRVGNPGTGPAISVHLYGPRLGELDGRDYDPSRDYVCGRLED